MKKSNVDDIREMIRQMETEMPELKRDLDRFNVKLPDSLTQPPTLPKTWMEKVGNWLSTPSSQRFADRFSQTDIGSLAVIPIVVGTFLTQSLFVVFLI